MKALERLSPKSDQPDAKALANTDKAAEKEGLEPADRITDIIELDYDPETGIALYGGFLEY